MIEVAQQVLEVHEQITGRLVTAGDLFREELERDAVQVRWNVVMEMRDGLGLFVDHIVQDFTQIGPGKWRAAREQKVDDGAETEEVAAVINGLADRLLGAHLSRGSEDMPLLRLPLGRRRSQTVSGFAQHPIGQAEVQDLDLAAVVQADMSGLMSRLTIRRECAASSASAT
jgi:hypothetical protein